MKDKGYFVAGLLFLGVLAISVVLTQSDPDPEKTESINPENSSEFNRTAEGTRYIIHPDEMKSGCLGGDCMDMIPSIDNPKYSDAEKAKWLRPGDRVIGVEENNRSRAFPLRILNRHEIVNTEIDGEPIVVTYCPLCRSGVTYSRELDGETLEFGVSGKLLDANLVMYDRETESYWSQIGGKAVTGPMVPKELELKFSSITNWSSWKDAHPKTEVLSRNTGIYPVSSYDSNPYSDYGNREEVGYGVEEVDGRLGSKKIVYGVVIGGEAKAYTREALENEKIIKDTVGGEPVAVFVRPDDGSVNALIRSKDGEKVDLTLTENGLVDSTGKEWSFKGNSTSTGGKLNRVIPQGFYWFAWSKFHPDTKLYKNQE